MTVAHLTFNSLGGPMDDAASDLVPDTIHDPFASPPPTVTLLREESTAHPVALAVAAAWSCYGARPAQVENVRRLIEDSPSPTLDPAKVQARAERRDRALALYRDLFAAGHHTTMQHASFTFILDNVSRLAIWSFFHAHPNYNSEQVSQRYREVTGETMVTPRLPEPAATVYREAIARALAGYDRLIDILTPDMARDYAAVFPARAKARGDDAVEKVAAAVQKRAQEVARYVLPLATPAHLYHTVNALTLLRYHALANQTDAPTEVRHIVGQMIREVLAVDPNFLGAPGYPLDLRTLTAEESPEGQALAAWQAALAQSPDRAEAFCARFDDQLGGLDSRLVAHNPGAEALMAEAVRSVTGLGPDELPDAEALASVLDGAHNGYLGHALFLGMHSKLMQTMNHVP
ncbi:MAG: FAD-dependent thymidylate synthase, partial [Thermomicrobiales bacterium]